MYMHQYVMSQGVQVIIITITKQHRLVFPCVVWTQYSCMVDPQNKNELLPFGMITSSIRNASIMLLQYLCQWFVLWFVFCSICFFVNFGSFWCTFVFQLLVKRTFYIAVNALIMVSHFCFFFLKQQVPHTLQKARPLFCNFTQQGVKRLYSQILCTTLA